MQIRSLLVMLLVAAGAAASPRPSLLVSPAWLATHLKDANLVLLHVGDKAGYEEKHIPGARHVSLGDISTSNHTGTGLMLEMPPPDDLKARLEKLGISDDSRVVVYYGKDWVSPTTRVVFTLDYAGLGERTSLLDGGLGAWVAAGHAVTAEVPEARPGKLSPLKIKPLVVDAAYVRANLGRKGTAVVDARTPAFYDGAETGGSHEVPHRTGHIAGARSVPFNLLTDDSLVIRPEAELRGVFEKAGVKPGDTVVGYCHIGQQATAMLFAARTLGHKVLLYDGSFEDWSRQADAPVEKTAEKKAP
jgi:thiosulfate/3-mercaptopyruvate sulfurtransferase